MPASAPSAHPRATRAFDSPGPPGKHWGPLLGLTRYQWLVLFAAWLGWGFDVFDGLLFNFVAPICVPNLLGFDPGDRAAVAAGLARLQAALARCYPASHPAIVYEAASHPLADARIVTITVGELSSVAAQVGDAATLFLPPREPRHAGAGSGTAGGSSTKEEP